MALIAVNRLWNREKHLLWAALMFYTRVPVPAAYEHSDHNFNQSRKYFPLIGLMTGALASLVILAGSIVLSLSVSVALSMAATILFTGCLLYTSPSPRDLSTSRMPSSA